MNRRLFYLLLFWENLLSTDSLSQFLVERIQIPSSRKWDFKQKKNFWDFFENDDLYEKIIETSCTYNLYRIKSKDKTEFLYIYEKE